MTRKMMWAVAIALTLSGAPALAQEGDHKDIKHARRFSVFHHGHGRLSCGFRLVRLGDSVLADYWYGWLLLAVAHVTSPRASNR